jgi:adenine-specific DNA-methyltransferase
MPDAHNTKHAIANALAGFGTKPLAAASTALLESLGYKSERCFPLTPNTAENFVATFGQGKPLNPEHALLADWQSVDFLFQLTDAEVRVAAGGALEFQFEGQGRWNGAEINSFLFLAITLAHPQYNRTQLSGITRAVNRLFNMPVIVLFRHGETLTLAIIPHRLHKRDASKDVLEKVTLIKDIRFANPHRAHIEILFDLSFEELHEKHDFTNFVALQAAWQKTLDSSELNKRFFLEVANWYFWALHHAEFPKDAPKQEGKDHISVIRLITRLMFCWFVKEKGLVPDILFDERKLPQILSGFAPGNTRDKASVFYKAILQNLFFATLDTEMDKRGWVRDGQHFMAHSLYRHRELFQKPADAVDLFKNIPFLNGGLFECLDKDHGKNAKPRYERIDGFSRRPDSQPVVPDFLFFGPETEVDLSEEYGDKKFRRVKVRGLIHTFNHYKFTIAENTPIEEEIALDPELSGKVFENLLAAYNPETGATARKQTGSFYTPREIVNYMVDEALIACLKTKVEAACPSAKDVEARLRHLFAYNDEPHQLTPAEVDALIAAIDSLRSLDPAVGSGAFPMGILHKLVFILGKLDPQNEKWKERQRQRAIRETAEAFKIGDKDERQHRLNDINEVFEQNASDFGRKLYLIENCIYGVDIQPIAVQIAKMRFFISLVADQKVDDAQPNRSVRPLPNLETKFVAANTLIGITHSGQQMLRNREIEAKEAELRRVRERHFIARSLTAKRKCREQDAKLRAEIADLLKTDGWDSSTARKLAAWNPYDQNASAEFFDPEWMFGITNGFDVVAGNPPYGFHQIHDDKTKAYFKLHYVSAQGSFEHYFMFYEAALRLLRRSGILAFIAPVTWLTIPSAKSMRRFVLQNYAIAEICWLSEEAFKSASVNTIISLIANNPPSEARIKIFDLLSEFPHEPRTRRDIPQKQFVDEGHYIRIFSGPEDNAILEKIRRVSKPLSEFARPCSGYNPYEVGAGQAPGGGPHTKETVREKPYHSISKRGSQWKPEIIGRDLQRYYVHVSGERWVKYGPWLSAPRDPENFQGKRLLVQEITGGTDMRLVAAFYEGELYHSRDVIPIKLEKPKPDPFYLLAILNSWLISWYHQQCNPKAQKGLFPKVLVSDLKKLPIFPASDDQQTAIAILVDHILAAKQKNPAADTSKLEREIDQAVYALYGLTPEEIKIVEGAMS